MSLGLYWTGNTIASSEDESRLLYELDKSLYLIDVNGSKKLAYDGEVSSVKSEGSYEILSVIAETSVSSLGDADFVEDHGLKASYMAGAMANGIASEKLVIALGKKGYLGSFGTGGLRPERIESAIEEIQKELPNGPYCFNLLHSPGTGSLEMKTVELYLKYGVKTVEAAAYISLSPELVYYRLKGLRKDENGDVQCDNKIIAKVSRIEVASRFMAPAPKKIVSKLLSQGLITEQQAQMAESVPMAHDITVEADSGGHTDNRPLVSLVPFMIAARDEFMEKYKYKKKIRIGAAGGFQLLCQLYQLI